MAKLRRIKHKKEKELLKMLDQQKKAKDRKTEFDTLRIQAEFMMKEKQFKKTECEKLEQKQQLIQELKQFRNK